MLEQEEEGGGRGRKRGGIDAKEWHIVGVECFGGMQSGFLSGVDGEECEFLMWTYTGV
jgi:hypothetical protein